AGTQPHHSLDDLEQHEADHGREHPSNDRGHDLTSEEIATFEQAQLPALVHVRDCSRRKNAGENRTEGSPQTVNAKCVERVVVAHLRLEYRTGQAAEYASGSAH